MSSEEGVADPPPSYAQATGSSTSTRDSSGHLAVPSAATSSSIPLAARRSMEDEVRPLPPGWVRQFDPTSEHQFFVDTRANPPRSIWHHPHDDETYLKTLSSEERERLQEEELRQARPLRSSFDSTEGDEPGGDIKKAKASGMEFSNATDSASIPGPSSADPSSSTGPGSRGKDSFGRRLKDKVTGTTHDERVEERRRQAEQEQKMFETHQRVRNAMQQAMQTGEPQHIGKDRDGKDVYIEPPGGPGGNYHGGGYPGRDNYRGYNPYAQGPYGNPNARFIRPANPYSRPGYGYGYGRPGMGMGLPIAGGLLGGLLIGGALGGF